ncbi:MAG: hypothetical protein IKD70_02450 [Eggerthellaceae bacterium]|nr:hypothetical protein [Eggerthellaceae bacterium]
MGKTGGIPWEDVYDYVLKCSLEQEPTAFAVTALEELDDLIPYNQGLVYLLDEQRQVCFQHLVNIKNRWSNMYLGYYSNFGTDDLSLNARVDEIAGKPLVKKIIWANEPKTEFLTDYIMARGVRYSLSFGLFDQNGMPRAAFSLDRSNKACFTDDEVALLYTCLAPVSGLFKNFFTDPTSVPGSKKTIQEASLDAVLTPREREVVNLLCQGLAPVHVAATLRISISTVYRHIANIYKKLHLSSQQELLVRVLGNR